MEGRGSISGCGGRAEQIMANQGSRRLVIDADVVHSAGETEHPVSSACRRFLETVLDVGHQVVMTDAIMAEWRHHMSRYSRRWRRQMYGRKRVYRIEMEKERDDNLRGRIDAAVHRDQKAIIAKDVHLIEAAIAMDQLVTSKDESARDAFKDASNGVVGLKQIVWVNPTCDNETPIDWLRNGARAEAHRQLGA